MTAPDTNDDLIARCQETAEKAGRARLDLSHGWSGAYAEDVPALIAALEAAQAESRCCEGCPDCLGVGVKEQLLSLTAERDAAQAENERLRGHDSKCESFFVEGAYAYTPCSCAERLALAERDRLRAKVKQGDALAAAAKECDFNETLQEYEPQLLARIRAALAAWEDTPFDGSGGV